MATHDLIYKSEDIHWTRHRVAYQVKALLENAEVSIEKAGSLKRLPGLPENNLEMSKLNAVKDFLVRNFEEHQLPTDMFRLTNTTKSLLECFEISLKKAQVMLDREKTNNRGVHLVNLPPYMIILQSILFHYKTKFTRFLKSGCSKRTRIFLTRELDINRVESSPHIVFLK